MKLMMIFTVNEFKVKEKIRLTEVDNLGQGEVKIVIIDKLCF